MSSNNKPDNEKILSSSFDLEALRLPQNFNEMAGVKRAITRVPVQRPPKTKFFRVRPGEDWRLRTMTLELKDENEFYTLASREAQTEISGLCKPTTLHTAIDRHNNVFLVPVPLPGEDGRRNPWHESLDSAIRKAEENWVRLQANKAISGYDVLVATADLSDPDWPEVSFDELVEIAFRGRIINSVDHPVIQQLCGRM